MVDYRGSLSRGEFFDQYLLTRRPVVFGGAIQHWPALHRWTPEYLKSRWGEKHIDHRGINGTLSEILDRMDSSSPNMPEAYLKNLNVEQCFPELLEDIPERLPHAEPNWGGSRLLPGLIRTPSRAIELFIGGAGSTIPRLHFDEYFVNNFIIQIYGTKEFWFFPPETGSKMYRDEEDPYLSMIEDPRNPDLSRFPCFRDAKAYRMLLKPGDTCFVAPGWWHWTVMPELSISIGMNCVNESNWQDFCQEFTRAYGRSGLKWRLLEVYLRGFGALRSLTSATASFSSRVSTTLEADGNEQQEEMVTLESRDRSNPDA